MADVLFNLPINGLDNFEAPCAPGAWNGFPVPLVAHDIAVQIAEAVGDARPDAYDGLQPYDGLQWRVLCPECGSEMEKCEGVIKEPVMTAYDGIEYRARPAVYWGCCGCEHCEEVSRG